MIKSWKHKGLKRFFETGSLTGIQPSHQRKLSLILERLDAAIKADDLNLPGMDFHYLSEKLKDYYSVSVNGNWRVIYSFKGGNAILVNYLDYH